MERYPDVKVCFEHAWGHKVGMPPYEVLEPLFAFADNPNVYIKTAINNIAAARDAGGSAEALYENLVEVFGAERIMWSSNYPAHPRFGSIKSRLDEAKKVMAFLSEEDRRWIFGETALTLFPNLR
jgi:predicted TIM-barrel fold metal-dependent hydrolase